ncbi:MAG: ADOP family duplicated permease [Gemmatimonas sp.]
MRPFHAFLNWIQQLFRSRQFEREMRAEMQAHIEQQAALHSARGMTARDALAAARRDFGNVGYLQEQSRDARGTRFIEETKRDLQYGTRALLRTPGFTLVAILSLAMGIGVNTALFTFMRYTLAPARVSNPSTFATFSFLITHPSFKTIVAATDVFSQTVASAAATVAMARTDNSPLEVSAELVSDGFFAVYGARPLIGRTLVGGEERDAGGVPTVVLSNQFWQREFGADSAIIGKTLRLTSGAVFEIVGVTRPEFRGKHERVPDVWLPLSARLVIPSGRQSAAPVEWLSNPNATWLSVSMRLAPGVTIETARMRLLNLLAHSGTIDSALTDRVTEGLTRGDDSGLNRHNIAGVTMIFLATIMVLLVGCANVANLVLARGIRRRRELAVRLSLGATRIRLIRQLMTENAILSVLGALLALGLNLVVVRFVSSTELMQTSMRAPADILRLYLRPDRTIVAFTFIVAFLSASASGLLPALRSTKLDLSSATRDDGAALGSRRSRSKLRTTLVIGQVTLSIVLLISASVLLRSAGNIGTMDVGFDRAHLISAATSYSMTGYNPSRQQEFDDAYERRLQNTLGTENVARGSLPMNPAAYVRLNPKGAERLSVPQLFASPNYFRILDIPIVRGRAFTELEAHNVLPVAVVSEKTANRLWPNENPLGKKVTVALEARERDSLGARALLKDERELMIVGVARDAQITQLDFTPGIILYVAADSGGLLARVKNPKSSAGLLRDAARITDPNVFVTIKTGDELSIGRGPASGTGAVASGAASLGGVALVLSFMGIFGVVAYAVSQRTREIGVRLALGAQKRDVLRMVIRQGMTPVLYGAAAGLVLAIAFTRVLDVFLFGVKPFDLVSYVVAMVVVCTAALLACYFPARRAMRVDPVGALRAD